MFGHSLGGAVALEACRKSDRFKACADLDGSVWGKVETEGVSLPYLVMLNEPAEAHRPPLAMRKQRDDEWAAVISKKNTRAFIVKISGTYHLSFSDIPLFLPDTELKKVGANIPSQRVLEIVSKVLDEFFSRYLNGGQGIPLKAATKAYKEITVKTYNN